MKKNIFIVQKCSIGREAKSIKLQLHEQSIKVPLSLVNNIFLIGGAIKLSNSARGLLLENNKSIFYYTSSYKLQGVLSNTKLQSNYRNRLFQYQKYSLNQLDIAQKIVLQKLLSMEKEFNLRLIKYKSKIFEISNINELLGIEGIASSRMFASFRKSLESNHISEFQKREYHPSKDKINGLLSFAYTLYSNILYGIVLGSGFDPYIGFLHKKRGTHYAFVSDLIEYDRAKITKFILLILIDGTINLENDFGEVYLTFDGRKKFLKVFDDFVQNNLNNSQKNLIDLGDSLI